MDEEPEEDEKPEEDEYDWDDLLESVTSRDMGVSAMWLHQLLSKEISFEELQN